MLFINQQESHVIYSGLSFQDSDLHLSTLISAGMQAPSKAITSLPTRLYQRQIGASSSGHFSQGDRSIIGHQYLPNEFNQVANYSHKMFCGTYSKDGSVFLSACQDRVIRVFDTTDGKFNIVRWIPARDVGWSILDTAFSPDGQSIIYSSWSESSMYTCLSILIILNIVTF